MSVQRRVFSSEFKAKVALAAIKGQQTVNESASTFGIHPNLVREWKKIASTAVPEAFSTRRARVAADDEAEKAQLYQQIGQLKVELDWLKKNLACSLAARRALVEPGHEPLSVRRQCGLLGLNRASLYYQPVGESEENLHLMRLLDEEFTAHPAHGVEYWTAWLKQRGYRVNVKRVRRLLRTLDLMALCPKPKLSQPAPGAQKYPYLLRGLPIVRINQVWSTDITYIRLRSGFVYLAAVLDWYSRYVLSWELSVTLSSEFCVSALERALWQYGNPEIFNTDQGVQFTSREFLSPLQERGIRISMDGKGRALDNVFVERLWRTVKYDEVYPNNYEEVGDARAGLGRYFPYYNEERLHRSLQYETPGAVYRQGQIAAV